MLCVLKTLHATDDVVGERTVVLVVNSCIQYNITIHLHQHRNVQLHQRGWVVEGRGPQTIRHSIT